MAHILVLGSLRPTPSPVEQTKARELVQLPAGASKREGAITLTYLGKHFQK